MKYFTTELWAGINGASQAERNAANAQWDANIEAYRARFNTILPRLPKKVAQLLQGHSFHDFNLVNIDVVEKIRGYKKNISLLLLVTNNESVYKISYRDIRKLSINYEDTFMQRGFDDWGYEEILDVDEQLLSHEILFASGATIWVHFPDKNIKIEKMKTEQE